jgi:hypothetical protein
MSDCDNVRISCAFPRGPDGAPRNWGNFPDYQSGERFAMMNYKLRTDAATFERTLNRAVFRGLTNTTLEDYFSKTTDQYLDKEQFVTHCLWPYLSIINGYGEHLMKETAFFDLIPLFARLPFFKSPLGAFTTVGRGWRRFSRGATSWLDAMEAAARKHASPAIVPNSKVRSVWTDHKDNNGVWVEWQDRQGARFQERFDKVVLTTDMWTNAELLNNPRNERLWRSVYSRYADKPQWPLHPGLCYIHTDPEVLSPDLRDQKEILQFTAYFSPKCTFPYYDLTKSFTTYIQKNLLDDPGADGIYVSMYGYVPDPLKDKVPAEREIVFRQEWRHGMWIPSFMGGPKRQLHLAQGRGWFSVPGQPDSNVYFAGNNTTYDSEEGALISAMAIANYAFGVRYPLGVHSLAILFYLYFYRVMFPDHAGMSELRFWRNALAGPPQ